MRVSRSVQLEERFIRALHRPRGSRLDDDGARPPPTHRGSRRTNGQPFRLDQSPIFSSISRLLHLARESRDDDRVSAALLLSISQRGADPDSCAAGPVGHDDAGVVRRIECRRSQVQAPARN